MWHLRVIPHNFEELSLASIEEMRFSVRETLSHKNGNKQYEGDFVDHMFEGKGTEYHENGTLKYVGDRFLRGYRLRFATETSVFDWHT